MATSLAKENILRKIRQALTNPVPLPFPESESEPLVFNTTTEDKSIVFAESFTKLQGKFVFCKNESELKIFLQQLFIERNWNKIYCKESFINQLLQEIDISNFDDLANCDVAITDCEYLVARTGTIVMSSNQTSGRTASVYAPVHICIARYAQIVDDLKDALTSIKNKFPNQPPSFITFASGPSRTADIEKTLVTGVHGPKEVFCFLLEQGSVD